MLSFSDTLQKLLPMPLKRSLSLRTWEGAMVHRFSTSLISTHALSTWHDMCCFPYLIPRLILFQLLPAPAGAGKPIEEP